MLSVGTEIGASALRLWVAAGSAAVLFVFCSVALFLPQTNALVRAGSIVVGAICGAAIMWAAFDRGASVDNAAERRALELRADELNARGFAPGSPLSCLDALAGETVEAACEKAIFASPASVAAASSFVAARFALLAAAAAYAQRAGADVDSIVSPLRRSLEADRFGFVAHVLAVRDNCTSENCRAFALLHDASQIRANLTEHAIDRYLEQHQEAWMKTPAEVSQAQTDSSVQPTSPPRRLVNIDFPSAASIPPISIMNPEPTGRVLPGVAAAAAANPTPSPNAAASASRRSRKPAAAPQTAGQSLTGGQPVEPIWPEPLPSPPSPQPSPAAGAPVQLNPSSPSARAGAPAPAPAQ